MSLTEPALELEKLVLVKWAEIFAAEALLEAAPASVEVTTSTSTHKTEPARRRAALRRGEGTILVMEDKRATFLPSELRATEDDRLGGIQAGFSLIRSKCSMLKGNALVNT